jgi:hypothetical protein
VSYILDALTKAAQQRDRQVPAVQRLLSRAPGARSVWGRAPGWLIAALTANAVLLALVLVWWSWPTDTAAPLAPAASAPAPVASAPAPAASRSSPAASAQVPAPVRAAPAPTQVAPAPIVSTPAPIASSPAVALGPSTVERPARRELQKADAAPEKPAPARRPSAGAAAPTRAADASGPQEPQTSPPSPRQAAVIHPAPAPPVASVSPPPSVRGVLKLEALIYSDVPAQRMVFVNGRRYVEGDVIDGRFRIEEIQDEGVQLSDQGRRVILRVDR